MEQTLIDDLENSFFEGPIATDDGRRVLTEEAIARKSGMTINIYAGEHPPPHFHVRFNNESASYAITDGSRLPNIKGLEKYDKNIRKWYTENFCLIIDAWNRNRPTDCPVGSVEVPKQCRDKI